MPCGSANMTNLIRIFLSGDGMGCKRGGLAKWWVKLTFEVPGVKVEERF